MGRPYSRVRQGARYQQAAEQYVKYLTGQVDRQPNIGKRGARPAQTTLYIMPFNFTLPAGSIEKGRAATSAWATYEAAFGSHTLQALPANTVVLPIRNYQAARVNIITNRGTTGSVKTSTRTGLKYLSYGGASHGIPFGRAGAADTTTEEAAFETIKTAIHAETPTAKIYLKPEHIPSL